METPQSRSSTMAFLSARRLSHEWELQSMESQSSARLMRPPLLDRATQSVEISLKDAASHTVRRKRSSTRSKGNAIQRFRRRHTGWRLGVFAGLCTSVLVLTGNIILLFAACRYSGYQDGIGVLAQGRSEYIARLSTVYHVLINVLSTLLLTSSNYCLQVLCSPSREDIDRAHGEGSYMDVGVLSFRNIRHVPGWRRLGALLLMLSSIPLHLFYNSAISEITLGHDYVANFGSNCSSNWNRDMPLINLTITEFLDIYNTRYVPDHGDICVVYDFIALGVDYTFTTPNATLINSVDAVPFLDLSSPWVPINYTDFTAHQRDLKIDIQPPASTILVDFAARAFPFGTDEDTLTTLGSTKWVKLSQQGMPPIRITTITAVALDDGSKVQVILSFILVVIFCNTIKITVMWFLWRQPHVEYFTTVGDAIQSFLQSSDRSTIGFCLESKTDLVEAMKTEYNQRTAKVRVCYQSPKEGNITSDHASQLLRAIDHNAIKFKSRSRSTASDESRLKLRDRAPKSWVKRKRMSFEVVSPGWKAAVITLSAVYISLISPVILALTRLPHSPWGTASSLTISDGSSFGNSSTVLWFTWVANAPQIILSILYVWINNYLTILCSAHEWNELSNAKKPLRVTKPVAGQRSSHFLQLPFRWAIPLTVLSGVMHWIMSQTIFLSRLETLHGFGNPKPEESLCTCGYSTVALTVLVGILFAEIGAVLLSSIAKFEEKLPVAANCSLVISAACHPPPDDVDAYKKPVQWGVVESRFGGIGHCSITSTPVSRPQEGCEYA